MLAVAAQDWHTSTTQSRFTRTEREMRKKDSASRRVCSAFNVGSRTYARSPIHSNETI